jgi:hypothetical protein
MFLLLFRSRKMAIGGNLFFAQDCNDHRIGDSLTALRSIFGIHLL